MYQMHPEYTPDAIKQFIMKHASRITGSRYDEGRGLVQAAMV
jgi:hypothetical protein